MNTDFFFTHKSLLQFRIITLLVLLFAITGCQALPTMGVQGEDVMVPMPDGVRLATTLYLPQGDGPWPAILIRTPYGRGDEKKSCQDLAKYGIACVAQDSRGRFDSEGVDSVFFADNEDGHATLEWITAQPWSNGKIMTMGGSALGITQYIMAPNAPESLVFQWIQVATPDLYDGVAYQNGVYRDSLVTNWLDYNESDHMIEPFQSHHLNDVYWDPVQIVDRYSEIHVPAIHVGGWYDIFARGTINGFLGYQDRGGTGAAGQQYLVMGPWHHEIGDTQIGELTIPNAESEAYETLYASSIHAYLLDDATAKATLQEMPPVHYFTMGAVGEDEAPGNEWHTAETWPPEGFPLTYVYLHPAEDEAETKLGELSLDPPENNERSYTFTYDPYDPTPTIGGANLNLDRGAYDQRRVEARHDVLVYTSPVLEQPVEVTGDMVAQIWMTTNVPDTDIAVRLTDVYPDGRSMLVSDSIARARYHNNPDFTTETFLTPGEPVMLSLDLGPTSIIFNKGHRVRISVTSSNAPRFAPNPNTGEMYLGKGKGQLAHTTVLHNAEHPSALILPLKMWE